MCNTTGPGRAPVAEDFGADLQQRVELQSRLGRQMRRCIDASRGNGSAAGVEPGYFLENFLDERRRKVPLK